MAATTTLLGLVTPTQGTITGTWGDTVNYGISDYLDIAIAGTLSFAGDGAITLANTTGSSSGNFIGATTAQYMVIRVTGTQTITKIITGPSYSKLYMVDHAGATSAVTFKAAGQTGVSVAVGEKCFVYYNGTDYVKVASSVADGVTTIDFGSTGLTPNTATSGAVTVAGTLAVANGGTGLTAGTSGGVLAYTAAGTLASSAALTQYGVVYGGGAGVVPVATAAGTTGQVLQATTGGAPVWGSTYAGTVTSVAQSFTGGLISVSGSPITTSGTLALTVAGTSGGVPYFSSGTTWASSTALAASALVIGGGAGAAPSTTTTGTGVVTALGVNTGSAGAFVVNGGALGTPASGTVTNLTGTASININGTVGATTATTGAFTTVTASTAIGTASGGTGLGGATPFTSGGVVYASSASALATGSGLLFDGANLGVGTTPSAWFNTINALQVKSGAFYSAGNELYISANEFTNSSAANIYKNTGFATLYAQNSGQHRWYNAPSGTAGDPISFTRAMTLDASGNLGIGTSSPQNKLQVQTTTRPQFSVSYNGTTGLYLEDGTNSSWKSWKLSTSFGNGSDLSFVQSTNTSGTPTWAATAAMTLDASGTLLVGAVTAAGQGCTFYGSGVNGFYFATTGTTGYFITNLGLGAGVGNICTMYNDTTAAGSITVSGATTAFNTSSDYRLKENVQPMVGALAKVALLKPVTYKWKLDGSDGQGFIAHELAEVVPDCVNGEKDALDEKGNIKPQGIDTSFLVATLVKAIQEQQALITQLTARITALETA